MEGIGTLQHEMWKTNLSHEEIPLILNSHIPTYSWRTKMKASGLRILSVYVPPSHEMWKTNLSHEKVPLNSHIPTYSVTENKDEEMKASGLRILSVHVSPVFSAIRERKITCIRGDGECS